VHRHIDSACDSADEKNTRTPICLPAPACRPPAASHGVPGVSLRGHPPDLLVVIFRPGGWSVGPRWTRSLAVTPCLGHRRRPRRGAQSGRRRSGRCGDRQTRDRPRHPAEGRRM